ncbi:class I adenylate-forming enzyme family protein [Caulobacter sp. FWC2]|uniref:class I adenylate-forming enzyme family protein n=1 Tax=Caulobacter sp. FWC2 TaxID=69664 RepID=UPI000C159C28|nr:class I adenylate-forming enzyme family protein [Caulobacter sp. FWC2]PIB91628.1 hypothetical protein CSW62_08630 [Caulobacter sp. FWC2]
MFERIVAYQAGRVPDEAAIVLPHQSWSYGAFADLIDRFAGKLSDVIEPGRRILIDIPHLGAHWLVTLAVEKLGATSMALAGIPTTQAVLDQFGVDQVISDRPLGFAATKPSTVIDDAWLQEAKTETRTAPPRQRRPDDAVRIVVTSGTTGVNRMIMLDRAMLDLRINHSGVSQVFAKPKPRVISEIGPGSIGGFMLGLAAWMVGGALCQRDPAKTWAETLDTMEIDALILAPIQLKMALESLPPGYKAPPGLALFVAGGSLSLPLMQATRELLTDNIIVTYGATETGSVAIGHAEMLEGFEDGAGFIQPWAEVEILDADGNLLPPGAVGEVRVRGDEVVDGYFDGPGDPERASFKDGWFYPRDLGTVTPAGLLKVLGRLDDLLNLGGDKILPSRFEQAALSVTGVRDAAAFSIPNELGLEVPWLAYVRKGKLDVAVLQARLQMSLKWAVQLMEVPEIPRNALGKIVRGPLREAATNRQQELKRSPKPHDQE